MYKEKDKSIGDEHNKENIVENTPQVTHKRVSETCLDISNMKQVIKDQSE